MFLLRQYRPFPTIFNLPTAVLDLPLQPSYGCTSAYLTSTLLQYRYCRTYQHRTVLYYRYIQLPYYQYYCQYYYRFSSTLRLVVLYRYSCTTVAYGTILYIDTMLYRL